MTANNNLVTNFNVDPYYDDYDETKNFHRILYSWQKLWAMSM